jgi:hypothetical protein
MLPFTPLYYAPVIQNTINYRYYLVRARPHEQGLLRVTGWREWCRDVKGIGGNRQGSGRRQCTRWPAKEGQNADKTIHIKSAEVG